MCFGGDSGGGNTSTVVQSNTLPPVVDQGYQQLLAMGTAGANIPYTAYTAPRIAGFTDMQNQGFAQTGTAANSYQPYLDQSQQYTQQGAQPIAPTLGSFDQSAFQQYGNPYTQDVINSSNQEIQRQGTIGNQTIAGNAAQAGAFGGDRATVAQTENNRNTLNTIARNTDTLNQQNFQQAQGQFNTEQNRGLAARESDASAAARAAGAEAALGGQAQQQGLAGASALLGAGAQQQQMNQSGLNLAYSDFKQQQLWPQEQATYLNSIIHGLAAPTSSSTTSPGPSIAGQVGGLAATGVGALGASGAFGSSGWLTGTSGTSMAAGQAASDVASGASIWNRGGLVGYAPGGTVDPEQYPGPDEYSDPSNDNSVPGGSVYSLPVGPPQDSQVNLLGRMSNSQVIAARGDPEYTPSLVSAEIKKRGLNPGVASLTPQQLEPQPSGYGPALPPSPTNPSGQQLPMPSKPIDDWLKSIRPATSAEDALRQMQRPETDAAPPPPVTKDTDVGDASPPPPSSGIKAANAAETSGDTSPPVTLVPGGGTLTQKPADWRQRPVGSKDGPDAPPQAGIGGPPPGIDRNGIAPPAPAMARPPVAPANGIAGNVPTGARVPAPVPPVIPQGAGAQPGGPPLGIDHNGIGPAPGVAPPSSAHPDWVNGAPPPAPMATNPNTLSGINPYLALMKGGAAMAASRSPFALTAAGEGALAGTADIEHQQQIAAATGLKTAELARKTAQDKATAAYQLARVTSRDELTRQQAQWHQDEIAARRDAASERSQDRRMALLQHADALAQNQELGRARLAELQYQHDQQPTAEDRQRTSADREYNDYLKAHKSTANIDGPDPITEAHARDYVITAHPDSPQAKVWKAARDTPAALVGGTPKEQLIPHQVYNVGGKPQRWNGQSFDNP